MFLIGISPKVQCPATGLVNAGIGVAFAQGQNPLHFFFPVPVVLKEGFQESRCLFPDLSHVRSVGFLCFRLLVRWEVFRAGDVSAFAFRLLVQGYFLLVLIQFDQQPVALDAKGFPDQGVGNGVIILLKSDVTQPINFVLFPLIEFIAVSG